MSISLRFHWVSWPSGLVHWTQVLMLECGFESWPGRSLSKTLNHNCFVLRMGRKAVGPVCCVMHVKKPRTLTCIVKEKEACPGVSGFAPWAPSRVDMCALQIFCIIIMIFFRMTGIVTNFTLITFRLSFSCNCNWVITKRVCIPCMYMYAPFKFHVSNLSFIIHTFLRLWGYQCHILGHRVTYCNISIIYWFTFTVGSTWGLH